MNLTHAGTAFVAAFLGSLVEFVEALTIVLAVGVTRGWRSALGGAAAGIAALAIAIALLGPALLRFPLASLRLVVGVLLLLFGMRWLRKAILRAAGVLKLHDETAIFADEVASLRPTSPVATDHVVDGIAFAASFKAVVLEGLEIVFIVIATGAGGMFGLAIAGAALAGLVIITLGVTLRRPLARVPENTLKLAVGVLLSAFGTFWIGEGLSFPWPGEDIAVVGLAAGFLLIALAIVALLRPLNAVRTARESGSIG